MTFSGNWGVQCAKILFSPTAATTAEIAYATHPNEKVTGVSTLPVTQARAIRITSPPTMRRMENTSPGFLH